MSEEKTYSEEFNVEGTPNVEIGNVRGRITVRPGPDGVVKVEAVQHTDYGSKVKIKQLEDGTVVAKVKSQKTLGFLTGMTTKSDKVDFDVQVPANTNLTVKSVSALADVEGVSGQVHVSTVSGTLEARALSGDLHLESVSGKIEGAEIAGPLRLRTVSGSVTLLGSDFPSLNARTVSGSMKLETPIGEGPYSLDSVSGSVKMLAGETATGRVHFKSISGSASVNGSRLKSSGISNGRPRTGTYVLSEEGPDITFSSVSGSLKILTDGDFEQPDVVVEEAPAPAPVQKDVMSVLEKIASGEMSVDDGVEALGS